MLEQLEAIRERFLEVEQQIAMPEVVSDLKKYKTLSKEYKDLQKIVDQYSIYLNLLKFLLFLHHQPCKLPSSVCAYALGYSKHGLSPL